VKIRTRAVQCISPEDLICGAGVLCEYGKAEFNISTARPIRRKRRLTGHRLQLSATEYHYYSPSLVAFMCRCAVRPVNNFIIVIFAFFYKLNNIFLAVFFSTYVLESSQSIHPLKVERIFFHAVHMILYVINI